MWNVFTAEIFYARWRRIKGLKSFKTLLPVNQKINQIFFKGYWFMQENYLSDAEMYICAVPKWEVTLKWKWKIKSRFIFNRIESVTTWEGADMWKRHCKHDL